MSYAVVLLTPNGFFAAHPHLEAFASVVNYVIPPEPQMAASEFPDAVRLQQVVLLAFFPAMTFGITRNVRRLYPLQTGIYFRIEVAKYLALAALCAACIVWPTDHPVLIKLVRIGSNRLINGTLRFAQFFVLGVCVSNIYTPAKERSLTKARKNT